MSGRQQLAQRTIDRCRALAACTEEPGRTTRTFLSPPMREVHALVSEWFEAAGCPVAIDAAGNLRALYAGSHPAARRFLIGSHLDTVPNAGAFDGILGVMLGLALVENLAGRTLPYPLEIVGFSEEEGVRYGFPFIGSRALVNGLTPREIDLITPALREFGLDPGRLSLARLPDTVAGYLEIHIEQGPVLDHLNLPLGLVEAIAGQSRFQLSFSGSANHAGTTPMALRKDALACAAEWIWHVEQLALANSDLVATVGRLEVEPGASNVIPGCVRASLDVRSTSDAIRTQAASSLVESAQAIASRRGLQFACLAHSEQPATRMDLGFTACLARAVEQSGAPVHRMSSGAGHDAMILAQRFPTAMLFVRSPGGISHHPDESVRVEDVARALDACALFLEGLEAVHA